MGLRYRNIHYVRFVLDSQIKNLVNLGIMIFIGKLNNLCRAVYTDLEENSMGIPWFTRKITEEFCKSNSPPSIAKVKSAWS
jgi:hypothetical protein